MGCHSGDPTSIVRGFVRGLVEAHALKASRECEDCGRLAVTDVGILDADGGIGVAVVVDDDVGLGLMPFGGVSIHLCRC